MILCIGSGLIPAILLKNLQFPYQTPLSSPQWEKEGNIIVLLGNGTEKIPTLPTVGIELLFNLMLGFLRQYGSINYAKSTAHTVLF
ncbi:hypothetical protein CKC_03075 [Candidatus Liberibacter solanacearum CLso-ZC1]|uniref:Uncharacterized protein n=1 Tax=Liberibacter solanacearum (strain CLso-ZC1) TaxID=658172 RepID=E4UDC4_LIBSC|nr:hypothetical protein CKC_03075 [Candidatus Liberibacter solanacearum CLso-ZC1]